MDNAYEKWCAFRARHGALWKLEEKGSVRLLKFQREIGDGIPCYQYSDPRFFVWNGDNMVLATGGYLTAYKCYEREASK